MPTQTTCWTLIDAAAAGDVDERDLFARRYEPLIRAYLSARWKGSPLAQEISDACQDFFVDCFRDGGPLARVERGRAGGFRPFLYGVARIVALRWEEKNARQRVRPTADEVDFSDVESEETELSQVFDRAWAKVVLQEVGERHREQAAQSGPEAVRRVELLQLRFQEGMPIREIAKLWETDAALLHRQYAKARDEFSQALHEVVSFHHPDAAPAEVQRECLELLTMLR